MKKIDLKKLEEIVDLINDKDNDLSKIKGGKIDQGGWEYAALGAEAGAFAAANVVGGVAYVLDGLGYFVEAEAMLSNDFGFYEDALQHHAAANALHEAADVLNAGGDFIIGFAEKRINE